MEGPHPIIRHFAPMLILVLSFLLLASTFSVNPHSTPWLAAAILSSFLCVHTIKQRPISDIHRTFAIYLAFLSTYLGVLWLVHVAVPVPGYTKEAKESLVTWSLVLFACSNLTQPAHFHFARKIAGSRSRIFKAIDIVGWGVGGIFSLISLTGLFVTDFNWVGNKWSPVPTTYYQIFFYFTTIYLSLSLALPTYALLTSSNRGYKSRIIFYLIGAFPIWLTCWANFLTSFIGINFYSAGGVLFLFHGLVLAYAVLWHDVFEFRLVLRRGLVYALSCVVIGGIYGGMTIAFSQFFPLGLFDNKLLPGIALVGLSGLFFVPMLNYGQKWIDDLFFRRQLEWEIAFAEFQKSISKAKRKSQAFSILKAFLKRSYGPSGVAIIKSKLCRSRRNPKNMRKGSKCKKASALGKRFWRSWNAKNTPTSPVIEKVDACQEADGIGISVVEGNDHLVMPITYNEKLLALVVLAPRQADQEYSKTDLRHAQLICDSMGVALQNAINRESRMLLEELTRETLNALQVGVVVLRSNLRIFMSNPAAQGFFKSVGFSFPPKSIKAWSTLIPNIDAHFRNDNVSASGHLYLGMDRSLFVIWSLKVIHWRNEKFYILMLHDLTEFKRIEDSLRRQEGLARVGEMVSTINHEIKNILQPIKFHVNQVKKVKSDNPIFVNALEVLPNRVRAMENMLSKMKDYARPIRLTMNLFSVRDMLDRVVSDITNHSEISIDQFQVIVEDSVGCIWADYQWLLHTVYNLVLNSVESIRSPKEGVVRIDVRSAETGITITIEDNGSGMTKQALESAFEPFFSTKGEGGTGLGLPLCKKIVELHEGKIFIESEVNIGTKIFITLPIITEDEKIMPSIQKLAP